MAIQITAGGGSIPVSQARAAEIVASGGGVEVADGDFSVRVSGGGRIDGPRGPRVSWASYGPRDYADTLAFARVVRDAGGIARAARAVADPFASVPEWATIELALAGCNRSDESVCYDAARRYEHGDVDVAGAWRWVISSEAQE